jgi:hypothetical protein
VEGTVKKPLQITITIVGVLVLLVGYWLTDNFIYPIKSVHPNYSDVEQSFSKLQFPADWKEISSSENKGLHGRDCDPFNNAGCFHKSKTFKVNDSKSAKTNIEEMFKELGCDNVLDEPTYEGNSNTTPKTASNLSCKIKGGVILGASTSQQRGEVSVGVSTR